MSSPLLIVLMGSIVDEPHCQKIADAAIGFGIDVEMRVGSAHKTARHVIEILDSYAADPRQKVFVTVAGLSNALSGFVDGYVNAPVIACPPPSSSFAGADVFSSLRMPNGISPAVILQPENAALLAARIFALTDAEVAEKVKAFKRKNMEKVIEGDQELRSKRQND